MSEAVEKGRVPSIISIGGASTILIALTHRKPLHTLCGFLPYSKLCERIKETRNVIRFLKPGFIDEIAVFYDPADDVG